MDTMSKDTAATEYLLWQLWLSFANRIFFRKPPEITEQIHGAAKDAAFAAPGFATSPIDQLQRDVADTTDEAVRQGKEDVLAMKEIGQSYLQQAKSTAQQYIESSRATLQESGNVTEGQSNAIADTLRGAANATLGVTVNVLSSAQSALSPSQVVSHVDQSPLETTKNTTAPQGQRDTKDRRSQTAGDTLHHADAAAATQPNFNTGRDLSALSSD
jgi:hypothetical protein